MKDYLMKTYNRKPVSFVRGEGIYLYDDNNKKYIDALCGLAVTSLGHSNKEITEVLESQSSSLIHTSNAFQIEPQQKLAKRLCQLSGMSTAFFCNSGAEAVEASIKIARKFGNDKNVHSPKILVMENSFHGRTMAALSATGSAKSHAGFTPLVDGFVRVPFNDIDSVKEALDLHKDIVAVLLEPIQGEGGIVIPSHGYLYNLREITREKNILLMIDEVQSGFCRTGKWFAHQHENIIPDVITIAKALGNGVPIGACLAANHASDILIPGSHGSTFGGNFLSCSVGLKVLDIMRDQQICINAREMGNLFHNELMKRLSEKKSVVDIRCKGLMIGIELKNDCTTMGGTFLEHGLVVNITKGNIIRMLPPLIINKNQVHDIIDILDKIIE
tara:strand:- start:2759 stop:3919 length:1161 start_codon:yes stop_codon:yes gene_type:complete